MPIEYIIATKEVKAMNCPNCNGEFDIELHFVINEFDYNDKVTFLCPSCKATFDVQKHVSYTILTDTIETQDQYEARRERERLESLERKRQREENERKIKEREENERIRDFQHDEIVALWYWKTSNTYYVKWNTGLNRKTGRIYSGDLYKSNHLRQLVHDMKWACRVHDGNMLGLNHYNFMDMTHSELLEHQKQKLEEKKLKF